MQPQPQSHSVVRLDARLVRMREVVQLVGLSKSTVYALIAAGSFPAPVRLGARAVAWRLSQVSAWIASRQPAMEQEGRP